jgi:hypothetical protein
MVAASGQIPTAANTLPARRRYKARDFGIAENM